MGRTQGRRQLISPTARAQDDAMDRKEKETYEYNMRRAEDWVQRYSSKGAWVQSINANGFYYRKPGDVISQFTLWSDI